ncbi:AraC family transcriptional regulator [Stenotrophomonas sp.]|uniref:AraC family transcriptional regulator n=1 Tax=Stenotrophomonas sp. TaxID=69392 RepID=UPI00289A727F|nr:AraC family transcriptional regulator [Stenotrophomonas sp.]
MPDPADTETLALLTALRQQAQHWLAAQAIGGDTLREVLPGIWLARSGGVRVPSAALYRPALGAVLQGAKQVLAGDSVLDYRAGEALLTRLPVPARGVVTAGNRSTPFMGMVVELDPPLLREVLAQLRTPPTPSEVTAFGVVTLQPLVLDCLLRLLRLAGDNEDARRLLLPTLRRELALRLLQGPDGAAVAALAQPPPEARRLGTALRTLQRGFREPLDVTALAQRTGMSSSQFYRRFREATSLSPLQYHKQLRLLEARRLLQQGDTSVASAAFAVGYESASQFSREYSRLFGQPPRHTVPVGRRHR